MPKSLPGLPVSSGKKQNKQTNKQTNKKERKYVPTSPFSVKSAQALPRWWPCPANCEKNGTRAGGAMN